MYRKPRAALSRNIRPTPRGRMAKTSDKRHVDAEWAGESGGTTSHAPGWASALCSGRGSEMSWRLHEPLTSVDCPAASADPTRTREDSQQGPDSRLDAGSEIGSWSRTIVLFEGGNSPDDVGMQQNHTLGEAT